MENREKEIDWSRIASDSRPVLVVPVFQGGARFERCLQSLIHAGDYFSALVLSVNGPASSDDLTKSKGFKEASKIPVQIFNSGVELNSMDHTRFWANMLRKQGLPPSTHLMWLGHDDELYEEGLKDSCPDGNWALRSDTMVLGPWKMRHESVETLYEIPSNEILETWTCFPDSNGIPDTSMGWVCDQLIHPTYLNLTGGIFTFESLLKIVDFKYRKVSGMRMEMTLATAVGTKYISELPSPITVVYGRADSDRATIPSHDARSDDKRLIVWLTWHAFRTPGSLLRFLVGFTRLGHQRLKVISGREKMPKEDWVIRTEK